MSSRPPRLVGGPLSLVGNSKTVRAATGKASVQMAKTLVPAALRISGLANNRHAQALGRTAINFALSTNSNRNRRANSLVNAMVNYYFSPGNFSPHTKNIAKIALNKARVHAPNHYGALKRSVFRKAPRILYKSLVR
jgi:hypothetical protein